MTTAESHQSKQRHPSRVPEHLNLSDAQMAELDQRSRISDEEEQQLRAEASEAFARMDKISQVLVTLREARKRKGLTQARVDEISGIGRANVSRLENLHLENPTLETVLRYADAIGVRFNMQVDDPGQ